MEEIKENFNELNDVKKKKNKNMHKRNSILNHNFVFNYILNTKWRREIFMTSRVTLVKFMHKYIHSYKYYERFILSFVHLFIHS